MSDVVLIRDSLRLCREEYANAYLNGTLKRWDSRETKPVPYSPSFIAVTVESWTDPAQQSGIVVPADRLFSDTPLDQVMNLGTVSRGKLWFEDISEEEKKSGYSPGKVVRFTHVEEHMRRARKDSNGEKVQ